MYMVYWTEVDASGSMARSRLFGSDELTGTMYFMEELRRRQREGESISMIALASAHPDSVGPSGVADPLPGYSWKKRRRR